MKQAPKGTCYYNFNKAFYCSDVAGHFGPCPLWPKWWNFQGKRMLNL